MSSESDVRAASERFYAALNAMANGDNGPMADVWSASEGATAQHPIGGRNLGRADVVASFGAVAKAATGGEVALLDQKIELGGDMAVETGVEKGRVTLAGHAAEIEHRVTNVYRREGGVWKIVHHHTDLSPALLDVLDKLKAGG
ncbi:nuclear transport factor 2 family protein [Defluviimonas sp. WL0024]|uniref:Nuclear transport factor 2 family protein n=1 Tax=Albidovulum salinarum TaxID=2984153 RepID=A0ABT2X194_9RHOB|nr:nuclear transport factor 2 family protein [Defluviimonas sp. WL0024]MCU9847445.1 nuclear transport factor 2 family protein [Defluviimonas sp. WL0024]